MPSLLGKPPGVMVPLPLICWMNQEWGSSGWESFKRVEVGLGLPTLLGFTQHCSQHCSSCVRLNLGAARSLDFISDSHLVGWRPCHYPWCNISLQCCDMLRVDTLSVCWTPISGAWNHSFWKCMTSFTYSWLNAGDTSHPLDVCFDSCESSHTRSKSTNPMLQ